jgi:hypothetical protein
MGAGFRRSEANTCDLLSQTDRLLRREASIFKTMDISRQKRITDATQGDVPIDAVVI